MTTHATCWKVTRRDTTVEGYTDHDKDLEVGGVTYKTAVGYAASAVERGTGMDANNSTVVGIIDSDELSESDLRNGTYTGARVEVFVVDWTNPAGGAVRTLLVGHLGAVEIRGEQYSATLLSLEHELSKPACRTVSLRCDADLGDTRCGYSLSSQTGSVTSVVTSARTFRDSSRTEADDYYAGGVVTFTSGDNNGRSMDVKKYTNSTGEIELFEPLPDAIAVSDTYSIKRGCDKTFSTCDTTFSNGANFRGFPHIPGLSDLVGGQLEAE